MFENVMFDTPKGGKAVNLVRVHKMKNGAYRILERSGDVTLDIVEALARKMAMIAQKKNKNEDLGYVGYNVDGIGKIVYIKPDCEFIVRKPY